jgi:hypothetical protein
MQSLGPLATLTASDLAVHLDARLSPLPERLTVCQRKRTRRSVSPRLAENHPPELMKKTGDLGRLLLDLLYAPLLFTEDRPHQTLLGRLVSLLSS